MGTRRETLRQLSFQIPAIRWGKWVLAVVAGYDVFSSQARVEEKFEPPTIMEILGMSGALLPWWGWLLVLQAAFVYALFEYVRRLPIRSQDETPAADYGESSASIVHHSEHEALSRRVTILQDNVALLLDLTDKIPDIYLRRAQFEPVKTAHDKLVADMAEIQAATQKLDGALVEQDKLNDARMVRLGPYIRLVIYAFEIAIFTQYARKTFDMENPPVPLPEDIIEDLYPKAVQMEKDLRNFRHTMAQIGAPWTFPIEEFDYTTFVYGQPLIEKYGVLARKLNFIVHVNDTAGSNFVMNGPGFRLLSDLDHEYYDGTHG